MRQVQTISREVVRRKRIDPSETTRRTSLMSKDLAILLGLLFTDGSVSRTGVNGYRIYFAVKSEVLAEIFTNCIAREFNLPSIRILKGFTDDSLHQRVVNSKDIGSYLTGIYGTFRTLRFADGKMPDTKIPVGKLIKSQNVQPFLQAAFCCDGGISFYPASRIGSRGGTKWLIRTVFLSCTHPNLRKDYMILLSSLGIKAREVPKDGKIKIEDEVNIRKFHQKIGFFPGVEVTNQSKYWRGFTKQKVLEVLIDSYGQPSKIYNLSKFQEMKI